MKAYAASKSPFTSVSHRSCARAFTHSSGVRLSRVAHPATTRSARTATTLAAVAAIMNRDDVSDLDPAELPPCCVERLFKLILHVKQNRKVFTTLCRFYNKRQCGQRQWIESYGIRGFRQALPGTLTSPGRARLPRLRCGFSAAAHAGQAACG